LKINQNLIGVYGIINDIEPSYEGYGKEKQTMNNEKVYGMSFAKIYPLLVAKAEKKGRTVEEVNEIICWLTGYENQEIENAFHGNVTYGEFFQNAPVLNPNRKLIQGTVCGVRVETMEESLMQEIRYLDKLIDELAKGRPMHKILRKQ